jgi:protein SCO1/2
MIARVFVIGVLVCLASCERPDADRHYPVSGQVIEVRLADHEVVVSHEDIPGYMQAMTMPFRVADSTLLATLEPGDLVRGRLVVSAEDGFLETLEKTGHRNLPNVAAAVAHPIAYLIEGDRVPAQTFLDHDGRPLELFDAGGAEVLTFIYTSCPFPTFCPLIDRQFQSLHAALRDAPGLTGRVRLLSITIDPDHDSTAVLGAHAATLGATDAAWRFVRAQEEHAGAFAERFGVVVSTEADEQAVLVHNLVTVLISSDRTIHAIYRGNQWTVPQLLASLTDSVQ